MDVALLMTDIVGSTPLWEHDAQAMSRALRHHDELVRRAVSRHGGRVIKSHCGGDGTLSVFGNAKDAVAAASTLRASVAAASWPTAQPLSLRIGVHAGRVEHRDGDYFGPEVNRCARLCETATGGQVLVSAAAAATLLASSLLRDLGLLSLRGTRPSRTFELSTVPSPRDTPVHARTRPDPPSRSGRFASAGGAFCPA